MNKQQFWIILCSIILGIFFKLNNIKSTKLTREQRLGHATDSMTDFIVSNFKVVEVHVCARAHRIKISGRLMTCIFMAQANWVLWWGVLSPESSNSLLSASQLSLLSGNSDISKPHSWYSYTPGSPPMLDTDVRYLREKDRETCISARFKKKCLLKINKLVLTMVDRIS